MANTYYDPGTKRAEKVKDLFSRIAPRYDLINDLQSFGLHRYWKKKLVALARPERGSRALDFCCGTGDIAFALARNGAEVLGLDFSEAMLTIARQRCRRRDESLANTGMLLADDSSRRRLQSQLKVTVENAGTPQDHPPSIAFVQGDAMHTGLPSASFDIATVGYGLRNLSDWKAGVSEMVRILKPGGRILVLDFGKPDNPVWRTLYFTYLRLFVPLLGLVFCRNAAAYSYILESLKHYPAQNGVADEMSARGLKGVRIIYFLGGVMTINYAEKPSARMHEDQETVETVGK